MVVILKRNALDVASYDGGNFEEERIGYWVFIFPLAIILNGTAKILRITEASYF